MATRKPKRQLEKVTIKGTPASQGRASGFVCVFPDASRYKEIKRALPDQAVIVTPMTTPEMVPYMRRAVAIVSERGGILCHAAVVSREFGTPCIVGVGPDLWRYAHEGRPISIDGGTGEITFE